MTKSFWNVLKVSPAVLAATLLASNSALAGEANEKITSVAQLTQQADSIGQVTSVSQFSDVQPTDWAFQALQSLVERYGCIAGYPNGTYRGNRALTRYEFAAGLNACLDRVNELIATATADLVTKEDLATLQRLQEEFSAELATLRGKVDALEARTAQLEANQFSTTTKLVGEVIFGVNQVFGDNRADTDTNPNNNPDLSSNTVFNYRARLNLYSSFSGKDQLHIRLQTANSVQTNTVSGTNMTRLGYDNNTTNNTTIDRLNYTFNLGGDAATVRIDAFGAEPWNNVNVNNPDFRSSGSGSISRFGRFSQIYRAATPGNGANAANAGITVTLNPKGKISLSGAYIAGTASTPTQNNGLFNGAYAALGQLNFQPIKPVSLGFTYVHAYQPTTGQTSPTTPPGQTPIVNSGVNIFNGQGSTLAGAPFSGGIATSTDNYSIQANIRLSEKIGVGGWVGYTNARAEQAGTVTRAGRTSAIARGDNADIWYWAANLAIRDFGKEGNTLGIIFGQPPRTTNIDGTVANTDRNGTSYHLEGLYKIKVSDNILITPGLLVVFNPEHNDNNDTLYVGTIRTTFTF